MFVRDQPKVQEYCSSPDALVDVITMVLLSIRQSWFNIGKQMDDVRINKSASKYLFGFKRKGYLYAVANKDKLFAAVEGYRNGSVSEIGLMREFLQVSGLGLVKAGFVCQLACGILGCMDSHNISRFGLDVKFFQIPRRVDPAAQIQVIEGKIEAYIALCETCGGTEYLWDSWCDLVAAKNPKRFADGDAVSKAHIDYLIA